MIISFLDPESSAIYDGVHRKNASRRLPAELWQVARRKLDQLDSARRLEQLAVPPGNRLERLAAERKWALQHANQRSVQDLLRMDGRRSRGGRDHGLSLRAKKGGAMSRFNLPTNRPPTHPGEMLLEEFLKPLGITQSDFAGRIGVSYVRLNSLVKGRRGVTPDTALRLERATGMEASFWIDLQTRWDLWHAMRSEASREIRKIVRVPELARARSRRAGTPPA